MSSKARSQSTNKKQAPKPGTTPADRRLLSQAAEETAEGVRLHQRSIHRILSEAIDAMIDEAHSIRGVAESLCDHGGLSTNGGTEELRAAAGVVRAHALGMLLSVVQIIAKSERFATVADVTASGEAA